MDTWIKFAILIIASYLLGGVPSSYLVARSRGIDLRKQGTSQVGGGNLWRTTSRKLGLIVGIFDFFKGMLMVLIAWRVGLDAGQQLAVGLAAVVGHNWSVFLRFYGGRGVATSLGIIIILPCININEITTWPLVAFFAIGTSGLIIARRTPVPILAGFILLPVISAIAHEPLPVTLEYIAMALIIIIKRLTAQPSGEAKKTGMSRLLLNRFLFDRDISDRSLWVHRKHAAKKEKTG
jgi:glycerol-3-phosphate acyltransferase PlsY